MFKRGFMFNGRRVELVGSVLEYLEGLSNSRFDDTHISQIASSLKENAVCYDVGANIGIYAIGLAISRPDFKITAFEPAPTNAACLRENIRKNEINNIIVVEAAVSDRQGLLPITDNGPYSAYSPGSPLQVEAITLDSLPDEPVDFVKIDTEGFEPNVFSGARDLFMRRRPLIAAEFNSWWMLEHGYNPLSFSTAIFDSFEILSMTHVENPQPLPTQGIDIAHANIMRHGCVTDLILRPKAILPSFETLIGIGRYAPI